MTCQIVQSRILALPDPRQVPDPLRDHLSACPGCAAWWQQAARLERLLGQLPAPPAPTDKKVALIDELTLGPVITRVPVLNRGAGWSPLAAALGSPGLRYAAGLAAAVLIVVGGWLALRPGKGEPAVVRESPRDPFLQKVVQRDLSLARATTAEQRLEALGGLADDLGAATRGLARVADQDELNDLARWFDKVVRAGIVRQADRVAETRALTPTQKRALFEKVSDRLGEAGREAERLSRESPPHAQPALRTMAESARDGQDKLRALAAREES